MILQLPRHSEGLRVRIEVSGEGVNDCISASAELTEIELNYPNEAALTIIAYFIDNGGKQVGDTRVLQVAAVNDAPMDEDQATKPEDEDDAKLALEDHEEVGVETDEDVAEDFDPIVVEEDEVDFD